MRLIDADALIEAIDKMEKGSFYIPLLFRDMVKLQPTAYDVEKVVAELEELSLSYELNCDRMIIQNKCQESADCGMCAFKQAIEVVRNGGKE